MSNRMRNFRVHRSGQTPVFVSRYVTDFDEALRLIARKARTRQKSRREKKKAPITLPKVSIQQAPL